MCCSTAARCRFPTRPAEPVAFEVSAVKAHLGALVLDDRPAAKAQAARPIPLSASLRLATGRFPPGSVDFKGSVGLARYRRRAASGRGRRAALETFSTSTLVPAEELLAWKALNVRRLKVALALSDFFARVIVMPDGRINLQDLMKQAAGGETSVGAIKNVAARVYPASASGKNRSKNQVAAGPLPVINFGPISLVNGQVRFGRPREGPAGGRHWKSCCSPEFRPAAKRCASWRSSAARPSKTTWSRAICRRRGCSWALSSRRRPTRNGRRMPNLIWQCPENSENTPIVLTSSAVNLAALQAINPIFRRRQNFLFSSLPGLCGRRRSGALSA